MSRVVVRVVVALIAIAAFAMPSEAQVFPDPSNSIVPECIRVSPDGSLTVPVTVIGTDGGALVGVAVRLIVSQGCSDMVGCGAGPPYVFSAVTDAEGKVELSPALGGCCVRSNAAEIEVDPGAVNIAIYPDIGSPDADGSLEVDLVDFTLFQAAFLTTNSCHDLKDCDGFVSLTDFTVFQSRFLAGCP